MNGFLNIYKPCGMSSAFCLNRIKKKLDYKCGHMGTLDPLACGILPVAVGQATRLFDHLLQKKKIYIAEFTFGYETDTLDSEGKAVKEGGKIPSKQAIIDLLPHLSGRVMQMPPVFSAKCVDGKKSYQLAREGREVTLNPKEVEIYSMEVIEDNSPSFKLKIECGGGTYIRSICRDIAHGLNTYGTMTALERVRSGYFKKEDSVTLEEFLSSEDPTSYLIPSDEVLTYPKLELTKIQSERILNGLYDDYDVEDGFYRVYSEKEFMGVGNLTNKKLVIKPYVRG